MLCWRLLQLSLAFCNCSLDPCHAMTMTLFPTAVLCDPLAYVAVAAVAAAAVDVAVAVAGLC